MNLVSSSGRLAALVVVAVLSACGVFKTGVEAQAVVDKRVVGMPAGDFFQTYGRWSSRSERGDGSADYTWISALGPTPNSGYYGLDERTCTLHLVTGRDGRIVSAEVVLDNIGRTTTSRCAEMFKP